MVLHYDYRTVNVKRSIPKITENRTVGKISNPGTLSVLRIHGTPPIVLNFFKQRVCKFELPQYCLLWAKISLGTNFYLSLAVDSKFTRMNSWFCNVRTILAFHTIRFGQMHLRKKHCWVVDQFWLVRFDRLRFIKA